MKTLPMRQALLALSIILGMGSCKKTEDAPNPETRKTGLSGKDNVSQIPKNIQYSSSLFGNTTLPASVDLIQYSPPVGDQGNYGTCVAWAAGYMNKTMLEAVKFGLTPTQLTSTDYQLSPRDMFTSMDDADKGPDCNGTNFVPALDHLLTRGVATMTTVPYAGLSNCAKSLTDPAWAANAALHKIDRYRRLDFTVQAVKEELNRKNPVILGAKLADNFNTWNSDAVIQGSTTFDNVGRDAYHAMCITGYDDARGPNGAFRVTNSWSANWADGGRIWVDYNYMLNGFAYNNNLFVASNDDQQPGPGPNPEPNPNPAPSGVDLAAWVYQDTSQIVDGFYTRNRTMYYDIFNVGTGSANSSNGWGYAYVYFNAYDANDYGIIFNNRQNSALPLNGTTFNCNSNASACELNIPIPGNSSLATAINSIALYQQYSMPVITGFYYLVMVADVTSAFGDLDEDNNVFYVTDQFPTEFLNGTGEKRRNDQANFMNKVKGGVQGVRSPEAARFRTIRKGHNMNAYSNREVISMLQDRVISGDFGRKVAAYRAQYGSSLDGGAR